MFVLIVVVLLNGTTQSTTMQEFTTHERCEAGGQKVVELMNQNRQTAADLEPKVVRPSESANNQVFIVAKACVEK